MALRGSIDTLTHRRIVGWAYESDEPNGRLWLMVAIGSHVLGRCRADKFREDLAIEGLPGWHGFELSLPAKLLSPREGYAISVRREGDGAHLPGSPYVMEPAVRIVRGGVEAVCVRSRWRSAASAWSATGGYPPLARRQKQPFGKVPRAAIRPPAEAYSELDPMFR